MMILKIREILKLLDESQANVRAPTQLAQNGSDSSLKLVKMNSIY